MFEKSKLHHDAASLLVRIIFHPTSSFNSRLLTLFKDQGINLVGVSSAGAMGVQVAGFCGQKSFFHWILFEKVTTLP
jgi:hypothetical protein